MQAKLNSLLIALAVLAGVHSTLAQNPVVTSFGGNGVLVCSNLAQGSLASVEWASTASGPWQTDWTSLAAVMTDTNGSFTASVPMFYRVRGVARGVLIPAGTFTMGDNLDNETDAVPTVAVNVSGFYMDANLVTYSQWQSVFTWATNNGYSFTQVGLGKAADHPVQTVGWYDTVKWCNARSQLAGLAPVYFTDAGLTQVYTTGQIEPYVNWTNSGYRLPTEAEWEKAARGGVNGQRFPWGNTISQSQANYRSFTNQVYDLGPFGFNAAFTNGVQPFTSPVGSFAANGYGLTDMSGNAAEWCWDWYAAPPFPAGSPYLGSTDPRGPTNGTTRCQRNGSWTGQASFLRCADRFGLPSTTANFIGGFRCVRRQ
ncbi:MAG TPA: SUMF1/EgtB/PvdO family nonheme iron enzyme [Verrucomicrobiae bacterium]|nr:SUMF1/EgtB/PvdO family nonheme iron enzyme [Verrucomicrobiae bacterium]